MKTLTNLIFLILLLLCGPIFLYYMYHKTYTPGAFQNTLSHTLNLKTFQEKINETQRLKMELEELNKYYERPLAQPARRFGQGGQSTNPNSQSPLSQPPRRIGQGSSSSDAYREYGQTDLLNE
jgi:hypothetical protein